MAKPGSEKAQKVDDGGGYRKLPLAISERQKCVSMRAWCLLTALLARFNGFNNGEIAASARDLADAIGSHRYKANRAALAELIEAGFIAPERMYPRGSRMATEYRLTWIESGKGTNRRPATNDWKALGSGNTRKHLGVETSTRTGKHVDAPSTDRKRSVDAPSTGDVETPLSSVDAPSTLLISHSPGSGVVPFPVPFAPENRRGPIRAPIEGSCAMDLAELRTFTRGYLAQAGVGAQSKLAAEASVPGGSLSKFLAGRGLAEQHRLKLQLAVGRAWPIEQRKAAS